MGIKMNTYAGGQMTAGNDAILHDRAIANTGILHGCNITFMGANQVHIEKGYLLIKGRYCTVTEDTIQVAMSNSETELPGRLYVRADLADAQEPVKILSVASDPLPKLTQDENFNYDNGVWEVELATYTAGMTAIKDLTVTCEEVPEGASKKETAALLGKIDELTENFGGLTFAQNASGAWGYKVGGAGSVIPFKSLDIVYVGAITSSGSINVTSKCPNYKKMTAGDFLLDYQSMAVRLWDGKIGGSTINVSKYYDPSTGVLSLSNLSASSSSSYVRCTVYVYAKVS